MTARFAFGEPLASLAEGALRLRKIGEARRALALLALAACRRDTPPPPVSALPEAGAIADAAVAEPARDASSPSSPPSGEPNLLGIVPSKIAVSSTVQNPRDFPEHIADGRLDTAWNGKTGDLAGGWIAFRVPRDARVRRIELTAGYDKVKGDLDLFTANHRITRVRVTRDGALVGEYDLDPQKRGMQSIPASGPGGDWRIEVRATLPGSKPEWKELVVSELRVVGDPGKERRGAKDPLRVVVGSLDAEPAVLEDSTELAHALPGTYADMDALCKAWLASVAARKAEIEQDAQLHDLKTFPPFCGEVSLPIAFAGDATYKKVRAVRTGDGIFKETSLVLELARGLVMTGLGWAMDDPLDPGCPSIVRNWGVESASVQNGWVLVLYDGDRGTFLETPPPDDDGYRSELVRAAVWCRDDGRALGCRQYDPTMRPAFAHKVQPTRRGDTPWEKVPWKDVVYVVVGPDGKLRPHGEMR